MPSSSSSEEVEEVELEIRSAERFGKEDGLFAVVGGGCGGRTAGGNEGIVRFIGGVT